MFRGTPICLVFYGWRGGAGVILCSENRGEEGRIGKGKQRIGGAIANQHFAQIFYPGVVMIMHERRRDVGIRVLYRMG